MAFYLDRASEARPGLAWPNVKMEEESKARLRRWVFTLNNWTTEEEAHLVNGSIPCMRYLIFGRERAPTTGTPHLQGYVEFEKAMTMGQVKTALATKRVRLAGAKGNAEQNYVYCGKEDTEMTERGKPAQQGTRTDLAKAHVALKEGQNIREMIESGTACTGAAVRYVEQIAKYFEPKRKWKPEVRWYWGEPGVGKSRGAREWLNDEDDRYVKTSGSGKWWDGYDAHPDVIWDDFRDSQCCITDLLGVLDRNECRVEIKNGMRQFLAKRIAVTSIFPPQAMYEHAKGEPKRQLTRRITEVIHVVADPECTDVHVHKLEGNTEPPT